MDTAKPFSTITAEGNLGEAVLAAEELFASINTNIDYSPTHQFFLYSHKGFFGYDGRVVSFHVVLRHALCEHKLKRILKIRSKRPVSKYDSDEMEENSDAYVEFVQEQIAACKEPIVLIEQKVDFSKYVPDGFGTADCLIVSDGVVHIVDYKNGAGVLVEIQDNPQLKCYALGALSMGYELKLARNFKKPIKYFGEGVFTNA